jgi:hypothetical protein
MQTTRKLRCAFNVINALIVAAVGAPLVALVVRPVVATGQVLPTRLAPMLARDSSRMLSQSLYPLPSPYSSLRSYSYSYSSSPSAGGISDRTARLTSPTALVRDTSTSAKHRTRNTILGAVIGLVAGAYIGGRIGAKSQPCGGHECAGPPFDQLGDGIVGALIGLVVGVVVGVTVSGDP